MCKHFFLKRYVCQHCVARKPGKHTPFLFVREAFLLLATAVDPAPALLGPLTLLQRSQTLSLPLPHPHDVRAALPGALAAAAGATRRICNAPRAYLSKSRWLFQVAGYSECILCRAKIGGRINGTAVPDSIKQIYCCLLC